MSGCGSRTSCPAAPTRRRSREFASPLARRPDGVSGDAPQGPRRADPRRCEVALCVGQRADLRDRRAVRDRRDPLGRVQSQCAGRLGERLLHRERDGRRLDAPRNPPLHGPRHHDPARPAPHAGGRGGRVQGPPRGQLLVRHRPAAHRAGAVADGLPAAVGPEGVLGDQGCHEHRIDHARGGPGDAEGPGRRRGLRPPHPDALLRAPRGRAAGRPDRPDRGTRVPVPAARGYGGPAARQRARSKAGGCGGGWAGRAGRAPAPTARRLVLARSGPA